MKQTPDSGAADAAGPAAVTTAYFGLSDAIFVGIAVIICAIVIELGVTTFREGMHTESTKANGEAFAAWLDEAGKKREAGEATGVAACDAEDAVWSDCRDALVAEGGPLAGLSNVALAGGPLFAAACDHNQRDTLGTILFERGLPKPPDGASLIYGAIADGQPAREALPLRVAVCGRGYSQINVREVKF